MWYASRASGTSEITTAWYGPGAITTPGAVEVRIRNPFARTISRLPSCVRVSTSEAASGACTPNTPAHASRATRTATNLARPVTTLTSPGKSGREGLRRPSRLVFCTPQAIRLP
jgi:hypothetical protein